MLESSRAWAILSFISLFEIINVVVLEPCMFFLFLLQSLKQQLLFLIKLNYFFFAKGIATFIDGPANLLNSDPKNPPDWIILEI